MHQPDRRGQVVMEYFVLFAVIAMMTVIGLTRFHVTVQSILKGFFQTASDKVAKIDK